MKMQHSLAKRAVRFLVSVVAAIFLTGCVNQKTMAASSKGKLLEDATSYIAALKQQGKLPGASSTEHGKFIAAIPWKGKDVSYPASLGVRLWKEGDDSMYYYALVRDTPEASWRLAEAAHCDKHDNVIEQLLPK